MVGALWRYQDERWFYWLILQYRRRTEIVRKVFAKFCLRAEIWGRFYVPFGANLVKIVILRGHDSLELIPPPAAPMGRTYPTAIASASAAAAPSPLPILAPLAVAA